jgi:hypothetical protein
MISSKAVDFFAHRSGVRDKLVAEREIVLTCEGTLHHSRITGTPAR